VVAAFGHDGLIGILELEAEPREDIYCVHPDIIVKENIRRNI